MTGRRPLVVTATYGDFLDWCYRHERSPVSAIYVSRAERLRGARFEDVVLVSGWDRPGHTMRSLSECNEIRDQFACMQRQISAPWDDI